MRYLCASLALCLIFTAALSAEAQDDQLFLTRAEASMLLLRSSNHGIENLRSNGSFPDVIDGQWYVPYVMKASKIGMMDAEPRQGLMHPHKPVSRAEFLKMMTVAFQLTTDIPHHFTDVPPAAWYRPYAGIAERHQLFINPHLPALLQPEVPVEHAEAVRAIAAMLKAVPGLPPKTEQQIANLLERNDVPALLTISSGTNKPIIAPALQGATFRATTRSMVKQAMLKLFRSSKTLVEDTKLSVIQQTNAERTKSGLPILRHNPLLSEAAQQHARDMYSRGYFSHYTPEGMSYVDRIRETGYMTLPATCPCQTADKAAEGNLIVIGPNAETINAGNLCECKSHFSLGENIAKGQLTPVQVVQDWMRSSNHRKNILQTEFEEVGIGIFGDVWVQNFGRVKLN